MKRLLLTSPKLRGHIELVYQQSGMLAKIDMQEAEMNFEQLRVIIQQLPLHEDDLSLLPPNLKQTVAKFDVTFDDFYNQYKPKHNKDRCIPLFEKLSNAEQYLAALTVREYLQACARLHRKVADPEKYLRDKYFMTNWRDM